MPVSFSLGWTGGGILAGRGWGFLATRLHFERIGEFFFRCCSSFLTTRKQLPMNWQGDCLRHEGLIADHCDSCVDVVDLLGLEVLKVPGFIRCSQVVEKQDCFRVA